MREHRDLKNLVSAQHSYYNLTVFLIDPFQATFQIRIMKLVEIFAQLRLISIS